MIPSKIDHFEIIREYWKTSKWLSSVPGSHWNQKRTQTELLKAKSSIFGDFDLQKGDRRLQVAKYLDFAIYQLRPFVLGGKLVVQP